eukprot:scaffold152045_cov20-Tisochrysis_lutea.AAC.1
MGAVEHSNPYSITAGVCTSSRGVVQREGRNMRGHDAAWLRTRTALERMEAHAAVTLAAVAMHRAGPVGLQPPRQQRQQQQQQQQLRTKSHRLHNTCTPRAEAAAAAAKTLCNQCLTGHAPSGSSSRAWRKPTPAVRLPVESKAESMRKLPRMRMTEPGKLQVSVKGHDQGSKGDWAKRTEGTITRAPWVTELGRPRDRMHSTTALCKKTVQATHSATALSDETANHALSNSLMHRV